MPKKSADPDHDPRMAGSGEGADGATPLSEIVDQRICGGFEVDRAVAFRDAEEVVEGLVQHGILKVSNLPIEATP